MTRACPLATVLYRFDDAARFPVFESHTQVKGVVAVHADRDDAGDFLRIDYQRQAGYAGEDSIVLALPIVAVDGHLRKMLLDVFVGAGKCHFSIEVMDGRGNLFTVRFGAVDFGGWRTLCADASKLLPPVQFLRLRADIAADSAPVRWALRSLSLTGEVRRLAAGIT